MKLFGAPEVPIDFEKERVVLCINKKKVIMARVSRSEMV